MAYLTWCLQLRVKREFQENIKKEYHLPTSVLGCPKTQMTRKYFSNLMAKFQRDLGPFSKFTVIFYKSLDLGSTYTVYLQKFSKGALESHSFMRISVAAVNQNKYK